MPHDEVVYSIIIYQEKGAPPPMPTSKPDDLERVYVLARAFCRNGTVNGSKEQRLICALVELRDHIKEQFLKVSKTWQVSAQELRRYYSYAYPASVPGAPDPLCIEQACEGLMFSLRSNIQTYAEQFGVPDDLLEQMLVDWLVSDAMGKERAPSRFFIPEEEVLSEGDTRYAEDKLPSVTELLATRPREADAPADGENRGNWGQTGSLPHSEKPF